VVGRMYALRDPYRRTSQNAVKAKFVESSFHALR
jgi:hypothetical protein